MFTAEWHRWNISQNRQRPAPEQVRVLALNDDEKLVAYAKEIVGQLRAAEVRVETDSAPRNKHKVWQYVDYSDRLQAVWRLPKHS